jgi:hypothetical protein
VWWFVWVGRAELLRACCARWLGTRVYGAAFAIPHGVGGSGLGHRYEVGRGRIPAGRRLEGSGVTFDELMKPTADARCFSDDDRHRVAQPSLAARRGRARRAGIVPAAP